jgi:hypothetical protein
VKREEQCMPPGRSSWLNRSIGLVLARRAFRRALAVQGTRGEAVLATVIWQTALSGVRSGMEQESTAYVREWAARLSHARVEVLVLDDHVIVQEDGELVASGSLQLAPAPEPGWPPPHR